MKKKGMILLILIFAIFTNIYQNISAENKEVKIEKNVTKNMDTNKNEINLIKEKEDYNNYSLVIKDETRRINGELFLPKNVENYPLVIIAHGFGGTYSRTIEFAREFAKKGMAAYVFDFVGGAENTSSSGSILDMSVLTEVSDYSLVFERLKNIPQIKANSYFFMGESQGGVVSYMTARQYENEIDGLILFYPAFVIPDDAKGRFNDKSEVLEKNVLFGITTGKRYYVDALDLKPYENMKDFKKPVLLVHGTDDPAVPISYSQRALELYPNAELVVIKGAGHEFADKISFEKASSESIIFIEKTLENKNK